MKISDLHIGQIVIYTGPTMVECKAKVVKLSETDIYLENNWGIFFADISEIKEV